MDEIDPTLDPPGTDPSNRFEIETCWSIDALFQAVQIGISIKEATQRDHNGITEFDVPFERGQGHRILTIAGKEDAHRVWEVGPKRHPKVFRLVIDPSIWSRVGFVATSTALPPRRRSPPNNRTTLEIATETFSWAPPTANLLRTDPNAQPLFAVSGSILR